MNAIQATIGKYLGFAAVILCCWLVVIWSRVFTAYEFGGDEGYELYKGYLMSNGYHLYSDIWNDQPPLHTWLLSWLFSVLGRSAGVGRCVSVISCGFICYAVAIIGFRMAGWKAAVSSVIILLAWPNVFELSISAMLEIPMMALFAGSLIIILFRSKILGLPTIVGSAFVFALGVMVKLTALLFAPAVVVAIFCGCFDDKLIEGLNLQVIYSALRKSSVWCFMVVLFALLCWLVVYDISVLPTLTRSHFSIIDYAAKREISAYRLGIDKVIDVVEYIAAAVMGVFFLIARRKMWAFVPVVMLLTVAVVHAVHRPYWNYYSAHFSVPVALLAGYFVSSSVDMAMAFGATRGKLIMIVAAMPAFLICAEAVMDVQVALTSARDRPQIDQVPVLQRIKSRMSGDALVFSDRPILCFHAGAMMPPQLCVLPAKRYWGTGLTREEVIKQVREAGVRQVVLFDPILKRLYKDAPPDWIVQDFSEVDADYWVDQKLVNEE